MDALLPYFTHLEVILLSAKIKFNIHHKLT
jgi:hypothetical protein